MIEAAVGALTVKVAFGPLLAIGAQWWANRAHIREIERLAQMVGERRDGWLPILGKNSKTVDAVIEMAKLENALETIVLRRAVGWYSLTLVLAGSTAAAAPVNIPGLEGLNGNHLLEIPELILGGSAAGSAAFAVPQFRNIPGLRKTSWALPDRLLELREVVDDMLTKHLADKALTYAKNLQAEKVNPAK